MSCCLLCFLRVSFPISSNFKTFQVSHCLYQLCKDTFLDLRKAGLDVANSEKPETSICNHRYKLSKKLIYDFTLCLQSVDTDLTDACSFLINKERSKLIRRPHPSLQLILRPMYKVGGADYYMASDCTCFVPV